MKAINNFLVELDVESIIILINILISLHLNKLPNDLADQIFQQQEKLSNDFLTSANHQLDNILNKLQIIEGYVYCFIGLTVIINLLVNINSLNFFWQNNLNVIRKAWHVGELLIIFNAISYNYSNLKLKHYFRKHIQS